MKSLGAECHVTGDRFAPFSRKPAGCRHRRASPRTPSPDRDYPLRTSLEAYFVEKLNILKPRRGRQHEPRIIHIASNTFREAVRDRVLYNLIAFALLLSGAAIFVGQISLEIERLVVINLGLTAVSLFGVVIAIFIGIGLVSKEIEKRTLYTVLSRPGPALGVYCRKILWPCWNAGSEHALHGHRCLWCLALCSPQVLLSGCVDLCGFVLHHSGIPDSLFAGSLVLVIFVPTAFGGIHLLPVCHRQLCRRFARICRDDARRHAALRRRPPTLCPTFPP